MKIWLFFSLLSIALADSQTDESNDDNDFNILGMNNFGNRDIYPFDAFNLGYDKFFSRFHPPLIAAMNSFVPTLESAKSDSERDSQTNEEQSVLSKSEKVSSEENRSKSESSFKSRSNEKDMGKSASESSDIGSGASILILKSVEKIESEVDRVSMSNERAEDAKSSAVSSDDVELNSAEEGNKKESVSENDARSVSENDARSVSEKASSSSEKIGSFSAVKMDSRESLSSEADLTFDPAYVTDEMTCNVGESIPDSWIASEIQDSYDNKDLAHKLTSQDIKKTIEDGYRDLAQIKKRLFKKEFVIDDLNQVIGNLQLACEKICQEVPPKYLVPQAQF